MLRIARRISISAWIIVLISAACFGQDQASSISASQRVKQEVVACGPGRHVKITESDGREVRGTVGEIRDEDFDVIVKGARQPAAVTYASVSTFKIEGKSAVGRNIRKGLLIAGIVFGAMAIIGVVAAVSSGGI